MNNEEQLKDDADRADSDSRHGKDLSNSANPASSPIKVSDDSNSNEILVFTSYHNVYKVQKKEISDKVPGIAENRI